VTMESGNNRAEYRAISIAEDHAGVVLQASKQLRMMLEDWMEGRKDRQRKHFDELAKLERKADSIKRDLLDALSMSETMLRRSDFFRLVMNTDDIADICEATAWDLTGLEDYQPEVRIRDKFKVMLDAMSDTVFKLRKSIMLLAQNSNKAVDFSMEVDEAERVVDEAHRQLLQLLYKSELEIKVLLRLKDLAQHIEEITDAAEDAADAVRIIAVARS
jgi:predicted phosphate transport protein (TIGR00153 family)